MQLFSRRPPEQITEHFEGVSHAEDGNVNQTRMGISVEIQGPASAINKMYFIVFAVLTNAMIPTVFMSEFLLLVQFMTCSTCQSKTSRI